MEKHAHVSRLISEELDERNGGLGDCQIEKTEQGVV
jgi:hypothetical protein